jgi:hypothetical protein
MATKITEGVISEVMRQMGRKGGKVKGVKKGFAARPKRAASKAGKAGAAARWAKKKAKS